MLAALASDTVLDTAYAWLCKQREHWPADADVWSLRFHWSCEKPRVQAELREGRYRFEPLSRVTGKDGEVMHLWSARDALVLKALALKVVRAHGLLPDYLDASFDQLVATLKSGLPKVRNQVGAHGQGAIPRETPDYVAAYALHLAAAKILFLVEAHKAMK